MSYSEPCRMLRTISLTADLDRRLSEYARAKQRAVSAVVRELISEMLRRQG
jgi:hypothetical protein